MRLAVLSLLLAFGLGLSGATGLPKEVRTYHDHITSLADSSALIQLPAQAIAATLEIRFTMPGKRPARSVSLLWNVADSANYSVATLSYGRDGFDNTFDHDFATLTVRRVTAGTDSLLFSQRIEAAYAIPAAENAFAVSLTAGETSLLFGHPLPEEVADVAGGFDPALPVGIAAMGAVNLSLVVTDVELPTEEGITEPVYSPEEIEPLIAGADAASPVGIWEYLDRDTDNVRARSGGRYRVAVVPSRGGEGYDIVYLGGAEVNPSAWRPGMIKGRLRPTPFAGHFDLMWVDSSLTPLREDIHASLDSSNAILTLSFPLLNSSLRLYRP